VLSPGTIEVSGKETTKLGGPPVLEPPAVPELEAPVVVPADVVPLVAAPVVTPAVAPPDADPELPPLVKAPPPVLDTAPLLVSCVELLLQAARKAASKMQTMRMAASPEIRPGSNPLACSGWGRFRNHSRLPRRPDITTPELRCDWLVDHTSVLRIAE
jgi:hypothetical protein